MLKVWERRVAGLNNYEDSGVQVLADRFNEDFTQVFKAAGQSHLLINMLHTMNELHNKEVARMF